MNRVSRVLSVSAVQARQMATKVSHEPPKKVHGPAGKYAMATYTAASKAGLLEKVDGELQAIAATVKKSPLLAGFLQNPTIPRAEKTARLGALLDEKTFSHVSRNLFLTLSANGRVHEADRVISAFDELMKASRGSIDVTIVSAEALKKKHLDTITAAVLKIVPGGAAVEVKQRVDPAMLGGLQVLVGDKFLDLSVAARVAQLTTALESA